MANNDQIILMQVVEEQRLSRFPSARSSDFFEIYVAEQILKDYDLSDDELESGIIGSGGDGGIDCIYTLVNGDLVREDFDHESLKRNLIIEVYMIQAKTSAKYDEDTMNRFCATTRDIFDLSKDIDSFRGVYNEGLLSAIDIFRRLYTRVAGRFPQLHFNYLYATMGDASQVHPNVVRKVDDIMNALLSHFSASKFTFDFLGASEILKMARRQPISSYDLETRECVTPKDGYIALVELQKFYDFIRDSSTGQIRKNLFESNVRDYQGSNQVNEEIQCSLVEQGSEEFWWLNNGVTIISTKAVASSKVLTIEDPQIVNGQQTSTEIFNYLNGRRDVSDNRCVMVRVIVTSDPVARDKVIKATNRQTAITPASLRATDKIHRDIEEYLYPYGMYYDRRKNSQKNIGRPSESIVSISLLAQAMMAIVLQRPDSARARPSSLLKKDEDYRQLFSDNYPISLYLSVAKLIKHVQVYLRSLPELEQKDKTNLIFYIAMYIAAVVSNKPVPCANDITLLNFDKIDNSLCSSALYVIKELYDKLGGSDKVAKGPNLVAELKAVLIANLPKV